MIGNTKQTCDRCKEEEYIPTYQMVKFDARVRYLCKDCWELFRSFYFTGPKAGCANSSEK